MRNNKRVGLTPRSTIKRSIDKTPACKLFFPFNEGSGNKFYENISGGYVTAEVYDHTTKPHAPQIYIPHQGIIGGNNISVPYGKKIFWFRCTDIRGAYGQSTVSLGDTTKATLGFDMDSGPAIFYEGALRDPSWFLDEASPLEVRHTGGTTWDSVTKEMRVFSGRAGAGVSLVNVGPNDPDSGIAGIVPSVIEDVKKDWSVYPWFGLGFSPFPQWMYSIMFYVVDNLPSDAEIIDGLNWVDDAHSSGHKELPPAWYGL